MKRITTILMMVLGITLVTVALSLLTSSSAPTTAAASTPAPGTFSGSGEPVTVVNTAASPVPVSGNVHASQSGQWNVNVGNKLNGSNPVPLLVQDVASPDRWPFTLASSDTSQSPSITLPSSSPSGGAVRMVAIEFLSADCFQSPGVNTIGSARLSTSPPPGFVYNTQSTFAPVQVGGSEFVVTQQTKIYADPGSFVSFGTSSGNTGCYFSISGHLIP